MKGSMRSVVIIAFIFSFVILIGLVILVGQTLQNNSILAMKSMAEMAFSNIYMSMDSPNKAKATMDEEGIYGIGVYASNGKLSRKIGEVPQTLPLTQFYNSNAKGDTTSGTYLINHDDKSIWYMRLARLSVYMNVVELAELPGQSFEFPDVLFVSFDGSDYLQERFIINAGVIVAIIILCLLAFFIMVMVSRNQKYREALEKQESLVSLGAAARTLAHEIKNPLSAMTLQTALMKKTLPEGYSEDLEILNSEINRLVQLTNRVNDFLRNPVGESQVIELKSFIAHIASLFPESIKVTGKSGVKVVFDPERARSVFENLIKNACESCTGRDPQVTVEVSLKSSHTAKVTVADRGDGIQVADRSRLFDPFFSTKIHGSGIGLAITKQFLRARNGDIVLKDRDGGGTIVEVTIPVERRIL